MDHSHQHTCSCKLGFITMSYILADLDEELKAGDKSLDDILPRGNTQPDPTHSFGSFSSSSVTRDSNGVSSSIEIINNTRAGIVIFFRSKKGNALLGANASPGYFNIRSRTKDLLRFHRVLFCKYTLMNVLVFSLFISYFKGLF